MKDFLQQKGFLWFANGTLGADLSWILALAFTVLFIIGWWMGRKGQGNRHHGLVLWAMGGMLVYFTVYYLARGLGALATEGKEGFGGPDWVYTGFFAPMLTIHILVVSIGLVLAIYMIVLGFRATIKQTGQRMLQAGVLRMSSSAFLKITASVLVAFALIAAIRCRSFACGVVYISGFLLVLIVLLAEKGIERLIPDGERRHRLIGTFTMVLYVIALITSSATYLMLYVIWPPKIQ